MTSPAAKRTPEVEEAEAQGKIKDTYEDIKATLRVPLVNLVFRLLANHPEYLELAWRQLKPNVQTVYFEQRAADIRAHAVEATSRMGQAPALDPAAADTLRVFHYVNPKLLLAVAALRSATNGQYPRLEELPGDQKRQIERGVPAGAPAVTLADPDTADEGVQQVVADIQSTLNLPAVNSDYRALAQWPAYLEQAWNALKPLTATAEYRQLERDLRRMAEETILVLPFRIEINPHIMRLCGLSEMDIDDIRATLNNVYRLLPGLIVNISFLSGALDADTRRDPYPAAVL